MRPGFRTINTDAKTPQHIGFQSANARPSMQEGFQTRHAKEPEDTVRVVSLKRVAQKDPKHLGSRM